MLSASSWSCVTMTVVRPSFCCSSRISTRTSSRSLASRLDRGSSSSSTSGRKASARASATRCCWPPESWRGKRSPRAFEPHEAQRLGDFGAHLLLRHLAHLEPEGDVLGHGHDAGTAHSSGTPGRYCASRRQRGHVAPAERDAPDVGSMKPAIMRKVVVLPQPEGPSRTRNSPCGNVERKVLDDDARRSAWTGLELQPRHHNHLVSFTKRSVISIAPR